MMIRLRHILSLPAAFLSSGIAPAQTPEQEAEDRLLMEVVKRVVGFDMNAASPRVQAAVGRHLASSRGSKEYFAFVERHHVTSERDALLELAMNQAGNPTGANAFKTLLKLGQIDAVKAAIAAAPAQRHALLFDALSLSQDRQAAEVILQCIREQKAGPEMKAAALKSLGKSRNGENVLLAAVKENQLPPELRLAAGEVLAKSADTGIRTTAAELLPMPKSAGDKPLPPVAELVRRQGDSTRGKSVYGKFCLTCHKLGSEGIEFGPSLMEIGSKLAREALFESILDPSAGVSFGFEGWEVKTKAGDTYVGMIAGETDTELSIRVPGGIVIKTLKTDLAGRKKLPVSLMTPGLAAAMTEQELVDLVEFLTSLKKR